MFSVESHYTVLQTIHKMWLLALFIVFSTWQVRQMIFATYIFLIFPFTRLPSPINAILRGGLLVRVSLEVEEDDCWVATLSSTWWTFISYHLYLDLDVIIRVISVIGLISRPNTSIVTPRECRCKGPSPPDMTADHDRWPTIIKLISMTLDDFFGLIFTW